MVDGEDLVPQTRLMASWAALRALLVDVEVTVTLDWDELDALVGGLPRSAYDHPAFWKGNRSGWPGFTTTDVRVGRSVTFVRRASSPAKPVVGRGTVAMSRTDGPPPDLVLVGCVKRKLSHAAAAQDLYDSPLFREGRRYAESLGAPWFILSAEHGLVSPTQVIDPYDLRLSKTPREYRRAWGERVLWQLAEHYGPVENRVIEVHAGTAYTEPLRNGLERAGAEVREPLHGLVMGQRLAWYGAALAPASSRTVEPGPLPDVTALVAGLGDEELAVSPADFLATGGVGLRHPGLYSWWVDRAGAADLSRGLGELIDPGLIYAGLAGATRRRSQKKSTNTLWARIHGMHLGGRHRFSTFRLSLGSVLARASNATAIDEGQLAKWMHQHLRVATVVVEDADALDALETDVLAALDPPLNLAKMPKTPVRERLTELRREYGKR